MHRYHNSPGHFCQGHDFAVAKYVSSCDASTKPRIETGLKSPTWGMDFVGPIKPLTTKGSKYILIVVDYFLIFLGDGTCLWKYGDFLPQTIASQVGWPKAIYCGYFVKEWYPES